jgi:hypothetical protein
MIFRKCFFFGVCLALTVLLAYWFSYPLDIFSRINFFEGSDAIPSLWALNWQLIQLSTGKFDELFTGNAFYPLDQSIYFNASIFSTAVLTLPVFLATKDPYICYGVAVFFSYILSSAGMFLLARSLKLDNAASFLAALIFSFSEARHGVSGYIHLLTIQWMPFILFFIHKYFNEQRRVFLYWASLFYLIQITASAYHGVFFSIILLVFVLILIYQQNNFRLEKFALDVVTPIVIVGTISAAYYIPYLHYAREFGFERSIVEQSAYGAPLASFFSSPRSYFLSPLTSNFNHFDGNTSPRYLPVLLTAVFIFMIRKKSSAKFLLNSKMKTLAILIIILTPIMLLLKPTLAILIGDLYPKIYLHPQAVTTFILSPFFIVIGLYVFSTEFFRNIYLGLRSQKIIILYSSISIVAFAVSLGPVLKLYGNQHIMINPIATFLYYVFPGLSSLRAVSRMSILIPLGLGITSGIAYMLIKEKIDNVHFKKIFSFIIFCLFLLEAYPVKALYAPYIQTKVLVPQEYIWLNKVSDGPVLEWPISKYFVGDGVYLERSMTHLKKIVNGFAAFEWDGRKKLAELTDLSHEKEILSLYAFGVRYLVVHRTGGEFPQWAGKTLGKFDQVEKFKNALVYINKKAKTNFLPPNFIDFISMSIKKEDEESLLVLEFQSPKIHYVSKNKKKLNVKMKWKSSSNFYFYDLVIYPTLWRDGDKYQLILDKGPSQVPEFVELTYSNPRKKNTRIVRKIMIE